MRVGARPLKSNLDLGTIEHDFAASDPASTLTRYVDPHPCTPHIRIEAEAMYPFLITGSITNKASPSQAFTFPLEHKSYTPHVLMGMRDDLGFTLSPWNVKRPHNMRCAPLQVGKLSPKQGNRTRQHKTTPDRRS